VGEDIRAHEETVFGDVVVLLNWAADHSESASHQYMDYRMLKTILSQSLKASLTNQTIWFSRAKLEPIALCSRINVFRIFRVVILQLSQALVKFELLLRSQGAVNHPSTAR